MDDDEGGYRWVNNYERSWEAIKDTDGIIKNIEKVNKKRQKIPRTKPILSHTSVMRHLVVIVDNSEAMTLRDYRPTRFKVMIELLERFFVNFFDQNPISKIGIISSSNADASIVCSLISDDSRLRSLLREIKISDGVPSIQNSLELAFSILQETPISSSREILIIYGSTTTCDSGDVFETLSKFKNISISVISLSAEMFLLNKLALETEGNHFVATDEHNFRECLSVHLNFLSCSSSTKTECPATLIKMAFPAHLMTQEFTACTCHLKESKQGFYCPQCGAKHCSVPIECHICGILLVLAPHLTRSYQRLFPLDPFKELSDQIGTCSGCQTILSDSDSLQCTSCHSIFCNECDITIHDTLGFCPCCIKVD